MVRAVFLYFQLHKLSVSNGGILMTCADVSIFYSTVFDVAVLSMIIVKSTYESCFRVLGHVFCRTYVYI